MILRLKKHLKYFFLFMVLIQLYACGHQAVNIATPPILPPVILSGKPNVALVLGGGGARGIAHAGALSVLEENNIPIDLIVGTSVGSIVGAMYADGISSAQIKQSMIKLKKWDVLDINLRSSISMFFGMSGLANGHGIRQFLKKQLHTHDFSQLKTPLAVVTTDIENGRIFVIRSGPIIPAVHASSAIPMIFKPVSIYGTTLVDGGVISPVPVDIAKQLGAKHVIAIDIGNVIVPKKIKSTYELADRSLWLSYYALSQWENRQADVLIQPQFTITSIFDDSQANAYYELGRQAAMRALPDIQRMLNISSSQNKKT